MNDTIEFPANVYIPLSVAALKMYAELLPSQENLSDYWKEVQVNDLFFDISIWTTDRVRYITAYPIWVMEDGKHETDTMHWMTLAKIHLPKWMKNR